MQSWTRMSWGAASRRSDLMAAGAVALALCVLALSLGTIASGKDDQTVDSGSFGVFINAQRVATETFSIHQSGAGSSIVSRFKSESGAEKAEQTSEWQMTSTGDLRKYEWKE